MINELKAVEKLIKDRLTEKSAELNKATWRVLEKDERNIFNMDLHQSVIFEIKRLGTTLSVIKHEIRTLQTQKHNKQDSNTGYNVC